MTIGAVIHDDGAIAGAGDFDGFLEEQLQSLRITRRKLFVCY